MRTAVRDRELIREDVGWPPLARLHKLDVTLQEVEFLVRPFRRGRKSPGWAVLFAACLPGQRGNGYAIHVAGGEATSGKFAI